MVADAHAPSPCPAAPVKATVATARLGEILLSFPPMSPTTSAHPVPLLYRPSRPLKPAAVPMASMSEVAAAAPASVLTARLLVSRVRSKLFPLSPTQSVLPPMKASAGTLAEKVAAAPTPLPEPAAALPASVATLQAGASITRRSTVPAAPELLSET